MRRGNRTGGSNSFRIYLKEISKIPLLTPEEEKELGRRIQSGDAMARQKLVESNLRFVIKIAKKFAKPPVELMDLVNAGNVGLIEAANRFDPDVNVRFTTYAVWWIRQAIFQYLAQNKYAFRIPPKFASILKQTTNIMNQNTIMAENLNREAIACEIGVSLKDLDTALEILTGTVSLDSVPDDSDLRLGDIIEQKLEASPEDCAMKQSQYRSLERLIRQLTGTERMVIRNRFGLNNRYPMTLQALGSKLGRSRERIRQIERNALGKLRTMSLQSPALHSMVL
jgi:RNA polymerase primary sigma factor